MLEVVLKKGAYRGGRGGAWNECVRKGESRYSERGLGGVGGQGVRMGERCKGQVWEGGGGPVQSSAFWGRVCWVVVGAAKKSSERAIERSKTKKSGRTQKKRAQGEYGRGPGSPQHRRQLP